MTKAGLRAGCHFDIKHGGAFDLLNPAIERLITQWLVSGKIWFLWVGVPCTRWSVARTTGSASAPNDVLGLACAR
eukprot:10274646-Heterocapsa_arctica.AAC.1